MRLIEYEGDDLVFTLSSFGTIARWHEGEAIGWMLHSLLGRLRRRAGETALTEDPSDGQG